MPERERSLVKVGNTVARVFNGETILVPIGGTVADLTSIFVLNEVAAHVWSLVDGSRGFSELVLAQVERYDVDSDVAAADVQELLEQFAQAGLVRAVVEDSHADQELHRV